ncbi:MAG: dTDP-4-dehydrorhamnose reductase [Bacteroidetes bacterium CG23_combo_of_CG06-09_8_20_14_all_32_9]|nr:MAG: dTDP-4-dehydrorhamnose reductase [Bacteroidetes bacterium CG23_combo_of_CG06-09_8_20_14_all_32_9]
MSNILITGANGQLGSEIREQSKDFSILKFIFTDIQELDITDSLKLKNFFNSNEIKYIVNCAAYTAVDKAETDKKNAEKINVIAVSNLIKFATNFRIKFIHISTDYVFDGNANTPYTESAKTNPKSVYGLTKLKGETEVLRYSQSVIIRTSWLYSSFGNNFVKTMLKLGTDREEIGVVYDQIGCPTYARVLANVILQIISNTEKKTDAFKPGIYHFANNGVCSWYDFAIEIMKLSNLKCEVHPIETKDFPTPAKRPAYSVLNKSKIVQTFNIEIPYWRDSLEYCMNLLKNK